MKEFWDRNWWYWKSKMKTSALLTLMGLRRARTRLLYHVRRHRCGSGAGARICVQCNRVCGPFQPDPCLGELPGVVGACCGHGNRKDAFIGWENGGPTLRGFWVDEEWDKAFAGWARKEQGEYVNITIPLRREALEEDANGEEVFDEEGMRSLGEMCVELGRMEYARAHTFTEVRPQ